MKSIALIFLIGFLVLPVSACYDYECNHKVVVNVNSILTQIAYITQQQSQSQSQSQSMNAAPSSGWGSSGSKDSGIGILQESQTYSRLMYPGEVLTFPVNNGTCYLYSGLPVAFYTIGAGHGYFKYQVQTLESVPSYNPFYHKMEFGMTPVIDKIDYWTMKAKLTVSPEASFCVVDNRAGFNDYTTIEVTVANDESAADAD